MSTIHKQETKQSQIVVRVEQSLTDKIDQYCVIHNVRRSDVVRHALSELLNTKTPSK